VSAALNRNRALRAWGANPPDWIVALADACDKTTQGKAARDLGISAAVVNQVLGPVYKGRMDRVETRVRGEYMKAVVTCPVLGPISTRDCLAYQQAKFRATNPLRVALHKTCPTCPNRSKACESSQ